MEDILKTGSSSIILGSKYYEGHFPIKPYKLLKITKIIQNHNEFKYLDKIKKIANYKKFYAIPDDEKVILKKNSIFYNELRMITKKQNISIFDTDLYTMYIDYAGSYDIIDSLDHLLINGVSDIWKNYNSIINFAKQMINGLKYLHEIKLCHLDVKPENIMISNKNGNYIFKLIDFGFCSLEPFDDFVKYYRGTPGYYPSHFDKIKYIQPGLPKIYANDMDVVNGVLKMAINRKLVYKIDSYCLGRVINYIYYYFLQNYIESCCFDFEYSKKQRINKIIDLLLENSSEKRVSIIELYYMDIL